MVQIIKAIIITFLALTGVYQPLNADFFVIPVNKKIKNVITVATSGGDFKDIKSAMGSITDANYNNAYVIYIAPGYYDVAETLVLKQFVSLQGSGKTATFIRGNVSDDNPYHAAIIRADYSSSSISNLTIYNDGDDSGESSVGLYLGGAVEVSNVKVDSGGSSKNYAIYIYDTQPKLSDITAEAGPDSAEMYGIYLSSSDAIISNTKIQVYGDGTCYGLYIYNPSDPIINDSTVKVQCTGTSSNYGIYNSSVSNATIRNTHVDVTSGYNNYGIYNTDTAAPQISDVCVSASNGSNTNYSIYNMGNSKPKFINTASTATGSSSYGMRTGSTTSKPTIHSCTLKGDTAAIYRGTARWSFLEGGGLQGAVCYECFTPDGIDLSTDCSPNI